MKRSPQGKSRAGAAGMRRSGQRMDQVTVMATEALATPTALVAFTVNVECPGVVTVPVIFPVALE